MSRIDIDKARHVSPTLRRRRSSSTQRAVGTRERMATAVSEKKVKVQVNPGYQARAEPFLDESLAAEGDRTPGWGPWIAVLLACASIATGFIIVSALQST